MKKSTVFPEASQRNALIGSLQLLWRDKAAFFSVIYLIVLFGAAIISPSLVGEDVNKIDFDSYLQPPSFKPGGHIFGTDSLGKDLFSRILIASRVSLFFSLIVVAITTIMGTFIGILAGYFRGILDEVIMRLVDMLMAFPGLLLVLAVIFVAGTGTDKLLMVLVATGWTGYTRVARAETLRLREFSYIESARCIGCKDHRIILKHIIPNLVSIISMMAAMGIVGVIMSESALSFIGLGVQPPEVSWGLLVAEGRGYLTNAWWLALIPGAAIFITSTAFSLISNWIGIVVDPVQRLRLLNLSKSKKTSTSQKSVLQLRTEDKTTL